MRAGRSFVQLLLAAVALALCALLAPPARAAALPSGFTEVLVAGGLQRPTAMQFAPDGRLFVCEQGGRVRVIRDGTLLPTPFVTLEVDDLGERGVLGVAVDPNFATNRHVYVFHTARRPSVQNRISRFTASGDVAVPGSEVVILELGQTGSSAMHNGGAIAFGPDGKLYVAVGDHGDGANSQSLHNLFGKMLRINADGSIPPDNPFSGAAHGQNRAIWAIGLRNPFTFAFHPSGHPMFINDVGGDGWEEIDAGGAGANYGFPHTEGPHSDPRFVNPIEAYTHANGACAIVGGAFYAPATMQFPSDHRDDYFFADFCAGWIKKRDAATGAVSTFATGISFPVDLKVAGDGSLYYLAGVGPTTGAVYRIQFGAHLPGITTHPQSRVVRPGASVTFSVRASGAPPLGYQWQRNGANIPGATAPDYTIPLVTWSDQESRYRAIVHNNAGSVASGEARLTVSNNQPPVAAILQPAHGSHYSAGSVVTVAATATDAEDGTLPPSAYTWQVDFHHDTHAHPFLPMTSGITGGPMMIPTTGETSANVWYRIYLRVRDSVGLTHTVYRDVHPRKVRVTLVTSPAGLTLRLDDQAMAATTVESVVGVARTIEAPTHQVSGGTSYAFVGWSDGGAARHTISTPSANATYVATYRAIGTGAPPAAPTNLSAHASGRVVSLSWNASAGAASYRLEAGTQPGSADVFNGDIGSATTLQTPGPVGRFFARVRATNPAGPSEASNEVSFTLSDAPCGSPPPAPAGYSAPSSGLNVQPSWSPSPGATSYILEAGSSPGAADLFRANVGLATVLSGTAPPGVYFTRIRAVNGCGASDPSNEVVVHLR